MCPWCPSWSVSAWLMKEVTRGQLRRIRRCTVAAPSSCSVCAGHSAPQAWSDKPASALGRVATPCLGAGAGRWTWEQRGSWTLDVGGSPGSPTYLQIVDTGNRGSEENKERSRWCGDDGSGEVPMIIVGGRGGRLQGVSLSPRTAVQKVPGIPGPVPIPPEPWGAHA